MVPRSLALLAACLISAPLASAAESEQVQLAAKMSEDASALLEQLLGPGRAKVFIRIEEGDRSEEQKQTETLSPLAGKKPPATTTAVLPGYATASPIFEKTSQWYKRELEQSNTTSAFSIKKIEVSLLLDDQVAEAQSEAIRKVLSDMLRLDTKRGDTLLVLRSQLYPPWKRLLWTPEIGRALIAQAGLWVAVILVCFVCFVGYLVISRSVRGLAEAIATRRTQAEGPAALARGQMGGYAALGGPGAGGALALGEFGETGAGTVPGQVEGRFGYLSARPPKEVARWLAAEPAEDVALLFGAVTDTDPALATRLFAALPKDFRLAVSKALVKIRTADPDRVGTVEARVREKVEASMAGPDKLSTLLAQLAPEERTPLIDELSVAEPQASRDMLESLITFETLAALSAGDLRRLVTAVPIQVWAQALHGAEDFSGRVIEQLPPGLRPTVREGLDTPLPRDRVLEARSVVLARAAQLAADGQIELKASA
jgi:hypothetical protein